MVEEFKENSTGFSWFDVVAPTEEDFTNLSMRFGIDAFLFKECMNPEHFPRFDVVNEKAKQLILRLYDESSIMEADTVRELTRKLAIFYGSDFIITVHRRPIEWLNQMKLQYQICLGKKNGVDAFVTRIIQEIFHSYDIPIQATSRHLEEFELKVFMQYQSRKLFQDLYYYRRKASVYREMIDQTSMLLNESLFYQNSGPRNSSILKRLKADAERLYFYSSKQYDSISYLINLHISLSSQKTNEVMRVLTVFSAFFLPLTFVVGIYGMNFKFMPELEHPLGYYGILMFMFLISVSIFYWFRRKGWLKFED